jgi:hypothetical protein
MTTDLEQMLAEGMARYAQTVGAPDGLLDAARKRRRRRVALRACTATGAAFAVAAATVILATGASSNGPQVLTEAYVVKKVQAALAEANNGQVMHATSKTSTSGKSVWWSYQDEEIVQQYSQHDTVQAERAYVVSGGTVTATSVSYTSRTWTRGQWTLGSAGLPFAAPSVHGQVFLAPSCPRGTYPTSLSLSWSAYLHSALTCGEFRYAGKATLNGKQAIVLDNMPSRGASHVAEKLWVDPQTYLPIREDRQILPNTAVGFSPAGTYEPTTTDFQWLPPTAANVAKVTLALPMGFRRVSP